MSIVNIYCDESCHLENDRQCAMVLGSLWCLKVRAAELNRQIAELKIEHRLSRFFEIKWNKVSSSKLPFYEALVELFFNTPTLHFRGWVIPDKSILRHDNFAQTHDEWYYKMYFNMLKIIIRGGNVYHVYLDIKDTRGQKKLKKLHEVLANANYDFQREMIAKMQHVHSHDIGLLQLADLLIGAVSYHARGLAGSPAKRRIVEMIQQRSGFSLDRNTLPSETRFNLCIWQPNEGGIHAQ
ncbi:MAG: DUF3800 domain-containing protein [Phycisphaerae bacterium]|nr:DUF3800 domain-containing protein [Phycisphaerae bacterium]